MAIVNPLSNIKANLDGKLKISGSSDASSYSLKNFVRERAIDGTRWNKVYPYVLRIGKFGQGAKAGGAGLAQFLTSASGLGGTSFAKGLSFNKSKSTDLKFSENRQVVLPITPQNISISTPAASTLSATLRGIVEEHNGAPFRLIKVSGTTGVHPGKSITPYGAGANTAGGILSDLFSNTIRGFQNVKSIFNGQTQNALADQALFQSGNADPVIQASPVLAKLVGADTSSFKISTGYMFFHELLNFVDQYFFYKKQRDNKDYYLVFEMQKDQIYYRCSITNFSWQKRPGTIEYDYTLDLKAWAYEDKSIESVGSKSVLSATTISKLQQIVASIKKTRQILAATKNIVKGLGQDVDRVFLIANELSYAAKDAIGVVQSIADLPKNVTKSFQNLVIKAAPDLQDVKDAFKAAAKSYKGVFDSKTYKQYVIPEQSMQTSPSAALADKSNVWVSKIFDDPSSFPDFFDNIQMDQLPIETPLQNTIDDYTDQVKNYGTDYWMQRRDEIVKFSNGLSNAIGAGSDTYNQILGFNNTNNRVREVRLSELETMRSVSDLISSLNTYIVAKRNSDVSIQNYVDFYVNLALQNGISMVVPQGKFAVPMQLGQTLHGLAAQYLGDASRWLEIAAVNQLRAPFIDEDGFEKSVKGFTNGAIITIAEAQNLYINQPIMVVDDIKVPVSARIKKIQIVDTVTVLLTLDRDVTGYGSDSGARIKAFLPNTVNSNMMIYIPTASTPTILAEDFKFSPDVSDQSVLGAIAGADIALTSEGDLAVMPSGDVRIVSGIANLLQAAKLKLVTPKGSIIQHQDYGLGVMAGTPTGEFDANDAFSRIEESFGQDDRFGSVLASRVSKKGGTVEIDVALGLPNTDAILPLTVNLRQ